MDKLIEQIKKGKATLEQINESRNYLAHDEWQVVRGVWNDHRLSIIESRQDALENKHNELVSLIETRFDKFENNHLAHINSDILEIKSQLKKLEETYD